MLNWNKAMPVRLSNMTGRNWMRAINRPNNYNNPVNVIPMRIEPFSLMPYCHLHLSVMASSPPLMRRPSREHHKLAVSPRFRERRPQACHPRLQALLPYRVEQRLMLRHLYPMLLNPRLNTTGPGSNRSIPWNTRSQLHIISRSILHRPVLNITISCMPQYNLLI